MYKIFTGNQRSLVFPIMCNAFATLDYSANIPDGGTSSDTTDETTYGIWSHEGDFCFEAVITPYDINGYGTYSASRTPPSITASKKIMPALGQSVYDSGDEGDYESHLYMSRTARLTHEMMIFHSTDFQISLVNSTTHNENQPAHYKIRVRLKLGSTTDVIDTGIVISPNVSRFFTYDSTRTGFEADGRLVYDVVAPNVQISSISGSQITVSSTTNLRANLEIFYRDGLNYHSLGEISSVDNATQITMKSTVDTSASGALYQHYEKDPLYINNLYHIACSYNEATRGVNIYLNGQLVKKATHSSTGTFAFSREDFYIGANGIGSTGAGSAVTNKQFMGEMHEMCLVNHLKNQFIATNNLLPNYDSTLFYLRFEEVDL